MGDNIPIQAPVFGSLPTPVEDVQQGAGSAMANQVATDFEYGNLGAELTQRAIGSARFGQDPRNINVPYDQAAKLFKDQGLDPSAIPASGWPTSAIATEVNRQVQLQEADIQTKRANVSSAGQFITSLVGQVGDPINLALGPLAGRVFGVARLGLTARLAAGAAEGGAVVGGYEAAQKGIEGHGADIASWGTVRDMTFGALLGSVAHGVFGPRPPAPGDIGGHLDMIAYAENSAGYGKAHGILPEQVVSRTGAVGIYQIEPSTARQYGWSGDPEMLKKPAYARQVAEDIMGHLDKEFKGDRDAIAIAWNAGPGRAKQWLAAGKDYRVLPQETRTYLARIYQQGGREVFGKAAPPPTIRTNFGLRLPSFVDGEQPSFKFDQFIPIQREMEFHAPAEMEGTAAATLPEYQNEMRFEAQPDLMRRPLPETEQPAVDEQGRPLESQVKLESQRGIEFGDQPSMVERNLNRLKLAAAQLREDSPVDIGALDEQMAFEYLHKLWPGPQTAMAFTPGERGFVDAFQRAKTREMGLEQEPRQREMDLQEPTPGSPDWARAKQTELWRNAAFRGSQPSLFDALPQRGRMFEQPTEAQLKAHPFGKEPSPKAPISLNGEKPKAAETAKSFMDETLTAAKGRLGAEKFNDVIKATEQERESESLTHDDVTKAVQAAVNCGVLKGLTYGAD